MEYVVEKPPGACHVPSFHCKQELLLLEGQHPLHDDDGDNWDDDDDSIQVSSDAIEEGDAK